MSLAITLTLGQLTLEYQNEKRRLTEEIENAATTFKPILSKALWNVDEEQTQASLLGVLGINYDVLSVQLLDANGILLHKFDSPAGKHRFFQNWPTIQRLAAPLLDHYAYEYDLFYESDFTSNRRIGKLILKSDSNVILSRAAHTFLITIVSAIFKTGLLAGIFYIIVHKMVGGPLKQITYAMAQLDPKDHDGEKQEDYDPKLLVREDELGAMVRTFKQMSHSLKQKDKAINAYANHLEAKVQERTLQVEKASQAKSDFLASVSHELRTPMNGVIGLAHLLGETDLSAQQRQYIDVIQASGESLINIINEILDHLKIESKKIELENTPFNLEKLFNECVALFSHRARESKINVVSLFSPNCPQYILGDSMRLRQVLVNLLGNAFKFTKEGSIVVKAELEEADNQPDHIMVSVTDTGIGIEPNQLHRLFKPFSQADSSTTRRYGGTGLGLAICKQLAELMGGSIGVQSRSREGSRFWFRIPLQPCQQNNTPLNSVPLPESSKALLLIANEHYPRHLEHLLTHVHIGQQSFQHLQPFLKHLPGQASGTVAIIEYDPTNKLYDGQPCFDMMKNIRSQSDIPILVIGMNTVTVDNRVTEVFSKTQSLQTPFTNQAFLSAVAELLAGTERPVDADKPHEDYPDLSPLHVLVAEDNTVNQMVIIGHLNKYGIDPVVVADGLQAIDYCKRHPESIDVILMDVEMPELDGWQAAKQIRSLAIKQSHGSPVPIFALSAHAMESYQDKATASGMNGFLGKPVNPLELREILMAAFDALTNS